MARSALLRNIFFCFTYYRQLSLVYGWAGIRLPQGNVIGFHCEDAGFDFFQVICPGLYLHAQEVDVCLVAAFLQRVSKKEGGAQASGMIIATERGKQWILIFVPSGKPVICTPETNTLAPGKAKPSDYLGSLRSEGSSFSVADMKGSLKDGD